MVFILLLFFASEISAIKQVLDSTLEINTKALEGFLDFGYIPSNMSIFKGINQLPPGFLLGIKSSKNGFCPSSILKPRKWWNFAKPDQPNMYKDKNNENNLLQNLENKLIKSVVQQSVADVKLASFLSGGIDSSLITTLLSNNLSRKVNSFTITFPDDSDNFNEGPIASQTAKILNTNHTEVPITETDVQELIPNLSSIYSETIADSSQVPTHLICREASKSGIKVALTGDGGDELFGGYNRHLMIPLILKYTSYMPYEIREKISKGILLLPFSHNSLSRNKVQKFSNALISKGTIVDLYESLVTKNESLLSQEILDLPNNRFFKSEYIRSLFNNLSDFDNLEKILLADINSYLPGIFLQRLIELLWLLGLRLELLFLIIM